VDRSPLRVRAEIHAYLGEVIDEEGLASHIRYRNRLTTAAWSGDEQLWTLRVQRPADGGPTPPRWSP